MEQQIEERQEVPQKPVVNPVLRAELAGCTILLGLLIDLVAEGPGGMLGRDGAIIIALFGFITSLVWRHGVETLAKFEQMKQEMQPYLPRQKQQIATSHIEKPDEKDAPPVPSPTPMTVKLNDRGERDELLHLGVAAQTQEPIVAHANRFFGKGILVSGVPECGKSNLAALLIEQMGKCYIPSVIFDYKHEYASLIDVVPNGIRAGYGFSGPGFYNLTVENAAEFAADVMENGFQAVVDLQSYGTLNDMAMVMAAVVNGLLAWSKAQPDNERTPCFVFEDEAHLFFPQQQSFTTLSKEVANMLGQSHFQLVTIGRSYGYTPAFFTQRLANIVKWLIATCQIKIIMRHSVDVDLDRCMEEVKAYVATREMIENMPVGHGVVSGLTEKQFIAHFAKRKSYHASHTPDIKRAHQRYRDGGTKTAMLPEMEDLRTNPLRTTPQLKLVEKEPVVATLTDQGNQHALPAYLQETRDILAQGNIPLSDLAKRLGVSKTTAHRYVGELKSHRKLGNVERSVER